MEKSSPFLLFRNKLCSLRTHAHSTIDTHHIDSDTCVKSEHLGNSRHFIRRQTDSYCNQRMLCECQQSKIQDGGLQKCCHTGGDDLLDPVVEPIRESSRYGEQVQTTNGNLTQQNTATLDICKHNLDGAVAEQDNEEQIK